MFLFQKTLDKQLYAPFFNELWKYPIFDKMFGKEKNIGSNKHFIHANQLKIVNDTICSYHPPFFMKPIKPLKLQYTNMLLCQAAPPPNNPSLDPKFVGLCILGLGISIVSIYRRRKIF